MKYMKMIEEGEEPAFFISSTVAYNVCKTFIAMVLQLIASFGRSWVDKTVSGES